MNAAKEICIAMLRQIPEEWDSAALVLTTPEHGFGTGLTHSAIAPTPSADGALRDARFVLPNMEVMNATRALELGWVARHLEPFRRATFITWRDGENWEVRGDYEYDD